MPTQITLTVFSKVIGKPNILLTIIIITMAKAIRPLKIIWTGITGRSMYYRTKIAKMSTFIYVESNMQICRLISKLIATITTWTLTLIMEWVQTATKVCLHEMCVPGSSQRMYFYNFHATMIRSSHWCKNTLPGLCMNYNTSHSSYFANRRRWMEWYDLLHQQTWVLRNYQYECMWTKVFRWLIMMS